MPSDEFKSSKLGKRFKTCKTKSKSNEKTNEEVSLSVDDRLPLHCPHCSSTNPRAYARFFPLLQASKRYKEAHERGERTVMDEHNAINNPIFGPISSAKRKEENHAANIAYIEANPDLAKLKKTDAELDTEARRIYDTPRP